MNQENQETALEILRLEGQLQEVSEEVKKQIEFYNNTKASIENLKQRLKESTVGKVKETITLGSNTLDISIHDSARMGVEDADEIEEDYLDEVKVAGVYLGPDGNFYKKEPNIQKAKNWWSVNNQVPKGFGVKTTRSISIKFNGEKL